MIVGAHSQSEDLILAHLFGMKIDWFGGGVRGGGGGVGGGGAGGGRRPITACKPLHPNQRKNLSFTIGDPMDDASTTQWLGGSRTRKFL